MNPSLYTLMLDASTAHLWIALAKDDHILAAQSELLNRQHSEWMLPLIEKLLASHQLKLKDINRVAVGMGPGSFTGVRLALTVAKTLGFLLKIKVFAMSSFMMVAIDPFSMVILDARASRFYWAVYQGHRVIEAPQIIQQTAFPLLQKKYPEATLRDAQKTFQDPLFIATHVLRMLPTLAPVDNIHALQPLYLKEIQ